MKECAILNLIKYSRINNNRNIAHQGWPIKRIKEYYGTNDICSRIIYYYSDPFNYIDDEWNPVWEEIEI